MRLEEARGRRLTRKSFGHPERSVPFTHGSTSLVRLGDEQVWRSELEPGWSWDEDLRPFAGGMQSCPYTHREYVVSGRIRYRMDDGAELEAGQGDALFIPPGHRAWVVGDERCVLVDW